MDYAIYFLFSSVIISILTKRVVFEGPGVLNTNVVSRYLLLRNIKYGQFRCTSGTMVFRVWVRNNSISYGNALEVQMLMFSNPTPPTESETWVGPAVVV